MSDTMSTGVECGDPQDNLGREDELVPKPVTGLMRPTYKSDNQILLQVAHRNWLNKGLESCLSVGVRGSIHILRGEGSRLLGNLDLEIYDGVFTTTIPLNLSESESAVENARYTLDALQEAIDFARTAIDHAKGIKEHNLGSVAT
jgi:hypothetical protein